VRHHQTNARRLGRGAHPTFKDAMQFALDHAQAWWEARGRRGIGEGKEFNAVAYTMIMRNRFRADYAEKQTIKHEGDSFREFLAFAHSKAGAKIGPANPHAALYALDDAALLASSKAPTPHEDETH
jgi:hypothetical protein